MQEKREKRTVWEKLMRKKESKKEKTAFILKFSSA